MRVAFLLIALMLQTSMSAQIITTVAGTGIGANTGDGGAATAASINYPVYGALDKFGNYYLGIGTGNRVRKISASGIITTFAGTGASGFSGDNGPATAAKCHGVQAVAVDTAGNVYLSDALNNRIRKVNVSTGVITTFAGTGIAGYSGDGAPATAASICDPLGLRFDNAGNLFFADYVNNRVRKISADGIISTIAGNGTPGYAGDGGSATAATILAWDVCVDDSGNVFIADGVRSVRKVDLGGNITTVVGNGTSGSSGDGGPATAASTQATYIALDKYYNLYISEYSLNKIRKVNTSGIIDLFAGDGTAGHTGDGGPPAGARISFPGGLCFDTCGNLYIPDSHSWYVRKVNFDTTCGSTSLSADVGIASSYFRLYPNPGTKKLLIESPLNMKKITACTMRGEIIFISTCNSLKYDLDITAFTPGLYMLFIEDENGNRSTRKFVKQ